MSYTRTYTIDASPGGDTVKAAVATKLDGDLTNAFTYLNAHDIATTSVHGFTGAKTGSGAMVGATAPTLVTPVFTTQITTPVIYGGSAANGDITIEGTSDPTKTTSYVILQPTAGNVGIGTTNPGTTLDVQGQIRANGTYPIYLNPGTSQIVSGNVSPNANFGFGSTGSIGITAGGTNQNVDLTPSGSGYVLMSGNVGIGTTAPLSKLSINGGLHVGGDSDAGDNNLLVDGTINELALTKAAVGFTLTGGTTPKTLTVTGDATISATPYTPSGTDVAIADGGTGQSTAQAAIDVLTAVSGATNEHVLTKDTATGNAKFKAGATAVTFATAAEDLAGAEAAKATAPLTNPQLIKNLKPVVNADVNELDIFTKSGGAAPDANNIIHVAIPDGNGYTFRSRNGAVASGTGQIAMADAGNYWSKGSLDAEIKTCWLYAIWSTADGGIVWALSGYSGFTRVPAAGGAATDDDWFLLEGSSSYTAVITDYCVAVAKIRYQYDTADTPDHTIQASGENAPQVIWNPKSDYGYQKNLATTNTSGSAVAEYSAVSVVTKQSGKFHIIGKIQASNTGANLIDVYIKVGSATYASAVYVGGALSDTFGANYVLSLTCSAERFLNAGDTIHLGLRNRSAGSIQGDDSGANYIGVTTLVFNRVD